jgi:hypothetical protein
MKSILLSLTGLFFVCLSPLLFAQDHHAFIPDGAKSMITLNKIKSEITNNNIDNAQKLLSVLFQDLELENNRCNVVCFMREAVLFFRDYRECYLSDTIRDCIIKTCSLKTSDFYCVDNQIELLLFYLEQRDSDKIEKEKFDKIREQDVSLLLALLEKSEKITNIDDKELEMPKSFFGDEYPIVVTGVLAFDDKDEEKRYKKYLEKIGEINRKRLDKKTAITSIQDRKPIVLGKLVSLYSLLPYKIKELETLLKKYNIDEKFSQEILDTVKKQIKSK